MNRRQKSFLLTAQELTAIKGKMLHWGNNQSNIFLFLDSNEHRHLHARYECICAVGTAAIISDPAAINEHAQTHKDWLFGHINYDYKNSLELLKSAKTAHFHFPELQFFQPEIVCYIRRDEAQLHIETFSTDPEEIKRSILNYPIPEGMAPNSPVSFRKRIEKEAYIPMIHRLRRHIKDGDCYELNFCNEAYCEDAAIDPLQSFSRLNKLSAAPFAAYYRLQDQYLLCASPERYLCKTKNEVTAQPIKGTRRRGRDTEEDELLRSELLQSVKERAENVMIVDLMRNDLAQFCIPGSIQVTELFGIYSFPQVHQMISTIKGTLDPGRATFDPIRLSFPMGSMTGAPKIMVMRLIEQYEQARRGLFSGSVGYFSPDGDFDFNVVIRSLFYNKATHYLSYQTGGAITWDSDPEEEWEETQIKAAAMEKVFQ